MKQLTFCTLLRLARFCRASGMDIHDTMIFLHGLTWGRGQYSVYARRAK